MAPFLMSMAAIDHTIMLEMGLNELNQRGLGNSTIAVPSLSAQKAKNLQIIALTLSSISVASAMLSFYWFLNMRRSFRHQLIMLLIQSDMFKALWFLIYPIVVYTRGQPENNSTFCQVNGFFISLGNEASDFAILMIAIHSALYIFRPAVAAGEGGLYPYRRTAYVLWVILPVLAASLAFINGRDKGYVGQGTYCYLPVRPFWFRLALSWIPRYAIFVFIFGIYATIYFYVRYKFRNFNKTASNDPSLSKKEEQTSIQRIKRHKKYVLPATPPLAYHGLIPDSRANSFSENRAGQASISTLNFGVGPASHISTSVHHINNSCNLSNYADITLDASSTSYLEPQSITHQDHLLEASNGFACTGSSCNSASPHASEEDIATSSPNTTDSFEGQAIVQHGNQPTEEPSSPRPFSRASTLVSKTSPPLRLFFNRPSSHSTSTGSRKPRSVIGMMSALEHLEATPTTLASNLDLVVTQDQNVAVSELVKTRDKIRKQLRFLFIYPLVYIAMWLVPFVNHALQYNDKLALNPPYALRCATVIFLSLQCAVDCLLFSTRERPWKHMPSNEGGTFWGSFTLWRSGRRRISPSSRGGGPGKSKAEQIAEARMAYKRREKEAEAWKRNDMERRIKAKIEDEEIQMERNWWDLGFDGSTMSPVVEELDSETESIDDAQPRRDMDPTEENEKDRKDVQDE